VGGRYHASKAPHKAVLLLAVIKLFENKKINWVQLFYDDQKLLQFFSIL
jgi:hypothetical protein